MLCVRAAARGRFYCAAIVSVPLIVAATSQAGAAPYSEWNDPQQTFYPAERYVVPRKPKARPIQKTVKLEKEAAKPQGPVTVAVSIDKQRLKVYDANGLFAEAPVSTGMKGHSTPMGVFSVIQKQKFHRSNIYSGAPMPFMQRITWSGVALHAGVLPGYPASHGCIRMPASFATRIYGWTRMGSRVLVTPGEVAPASFAHPLLAALKAPQPSASIQPDATTPAATKSDKGAALAAPITVATTDLRATIGHAEAALSAEATALPRPLRTADASNANGLAATASDASPSPEAARPDAAEVVGVAAGMKSSLVEPSAKAVQKDDATSTAADAIPSPASPPSSTADTTPPEKATATSPVLEAPALEATGSTDVKPTEAKPADTKITDQPAIRTGTAATAPESPVDPKTLDPKTLEKDQSRLAAPDKPIAPKPELKRNSQIAIFISRKDSKLYVRQNFAPVFNTPISIAPGDKPLGTHVFTATADKADPATMHWTAVSLPSSARSVAANDGVVRRGRKSVEQADAKPVVQLSSATEALDRITIPADVLAWLGEALSSGSSLIVSDQGLHQGETGEGTEFILSLR
ncbi:lipoprotein-anchoring transpeptidase ErfK/SrfK [Bradyrhizobium sp. USDA 4369]